MSSLMDTNFKKNDEVVARHNQDGTYVVMKMDDSNVFFKIEGVAAQVWSQLHSGKTPNQIIDEISSEYETTEEQARKDVDNFLKEVLEKDLILKA